MTQPRRVAHQILLRRQGGRVDLATEEFAELPVGDRHIAHDLVLGVRRHLFLIDAVLRQFVRDRIGTVPGHLREALRMGVYDLLFRERLPVPIVVHETVDLVGKQAKERGFVNAVLRRVSESFELSAEEDLGPDRALVWTGPGRRLRFKKPVLPDPADNLAKFHSTHYTVTEWLAAAAMRLLPEEHEDFFRASARHLPLMLRPTRRAGSAEALRARLATEGGTVLEERDGLLVVDLDRAPGDLPSIKEGFATVQDATPAEVAPFVAPQPGERILDLCAPPGGKTVHLAELMNDTGEVVACHFGPERSKLVASNAERLGLRSIKLHDLGAKGTELPAGPFDRALVDAPCSNTAVLMKRVDARYRVQPKELEQLAELQLRLLRRAARLVRAGGVLVYSTCSILPQENHSLVRAFLRGDGGFRLDEERLRWPHRTGRDGGYMARLIKSRAPDRPPR